MGDRLERVLLRKYCPHQETLHNRYYLYKLLKGSIYRALEKKLIKVTVYGSLPLRTFLPEGDIDITVITSPEDSCNPYLILSKIKFQFLQEFEIKSVQEISAEVPLLKFKVFEINVDVSINQIGGVRTLIFLEEICRLFPKHLMKKSIILSKAWGTYYSRIMGAINGLLTTYALEVLIVFILNTFPESRTTPLQVLAFLIDYFSGFDWENNIITCCGVLPYSKLYNEAEFMSQNSSKLPVSYNKLVCLRNELGCIDKPWIQRYVNIADPVFPGNNLGKSISINTFPRFKFCFQAANEILKSKGVEALFETYDPQSYITTSVKDIEEDKTNQIPISFFANIRKLKEALFSCLAVMNPSFPQNY
jgi:hypothetical protein